MNIAQNALKRSSIQTFLLIVACIFTQGCDHDKRIEVIESANNNKEKSYTATNHELPISLDEETKQEMLNEFEKIKKATKD